MELKVYLFDKLSKEVQTKVILAMLRTAGRSEAYFQLDINGLIKDITEKGELYTEKGDFVVVVPLEEM